MNKLYELIDKLDIELDFAKLPDKVSGLHCRIDEYNLITVNQNITKNSEIKSIIAEEIGHYYTSSGNNTLFDYSSYSDKLSYQKCEFKAMRWACDYLLPTDDLLLKIKKNVLETKYSIMNHYDVTENIVDLKFYYMSLEKINWQIDENRYLVLSSLPSIYIYQPL